MALPALALDADGDLYHGDTGLDCDDADALVNPGEPESLATDYDDDCDDSTHIRQLLEAGMANGAGTPSTPPGSATSPR